MRHKVNINQHFLIITADNNNEAIKTACEILAFDIAKALGNGRTLEESVQDVFLITSEPIADKELVNVISTK